MKDKMRKLVSTITDAMNGNFSKREFCEEMSREHRTLQYEFTELCIWWLEKCGEMYEQGRYDARNEHSCRLGKEFTDWYNR